MNENGKQERRTEMDWNEEITNRISGVTMDDLEQLEQEAIDRQAFAALANVREAMQILETVNDSCYVKATSK